MSWVLDSKGKIIKERKKIDKMTKQSIRLRGRGSRGDNRSPPSNLQLFSRSLSSSSDISYFIVCFGASPIWNTRAFFSVSFRPLKYRLKVLVESGSDVIAFLKLLCRIFGSSVEISLNGQSHWSLQIMLWCFIILRPMRRTVPVAR